MPHTTTQIRVARARVAVATALVVLATTAVGALGSPASAAVGTPGSLAVGLANSSTPVLSWTRPKGVTDFSIQIDNDPSFASAEVNESTRNTRFVPVRNLSRGTQYWRVRGTKNGVSSSWATGSFTVSAVSVPVGTYPADGAVLAQPDSPPLLRWQTSRGATSYTVEVDGDADFIGAKSWTTKTTSLAVPDALPAGDYFWRVTASLEGGYNSTPSPTMSFILGALPSPRLIYPLDDINQAVEDVVLDWEPVPGAVTYDLQVATDSTFNNFAFKGENLYGSRYSPPVTLYNDQFWWRVRAVDLAGQPTAWSTARFSFKRQWLDTPQAVWPLGSENTPTDSVVARDGERVFYEWTPIQHASRYVFQVSTDQNFSPIYTRTCTTAATSFAPRSSSLSDGTCGVAPGTVHYWRVSGIDDPYPGGGVPGIWSTPQKVKWGPSNSVGTFTGFSTVTGLRSAMTATGATSASNGCGAVSCGVMSATPVLTWDRQPGADYYKVVVGIDENFTFSPIPSVERYSTTNHFFALQEGDEKTALPESEAGLPYFWYVIPCRNDGTCGPSPVKRNPPLPGAHSFLKASPPASGLTSTSASDTEITFSWHDYFDTNLGPAGAAYGQSGQQSAKTYRVQVDNEPSFAEPLLDNVVVDQATYTAGDRLYPEGRLYWRVQAIDAQEHGLTWSSTAELVKASPPLALRSPANGAAVAGAAPLEWTPQPFARSYDVEIYKNNDVAFSPANRVANALVANPAYSPSEPLPASPVPYVWRVRRNDSKGNVGPWSSASFVSLGNAPELLAPPAGVWVRWTGAYLEWSDVPGATSYQLSLRNGASNSTTNTVATAFAPSELQSGDYTWSVTALDAGGKALGTSAVRNFRVDSVPPTVAAMKPVGSATPKSVFVVTFSEKVKGVSKKTMKLYVKGKKKPVKAKVVVKGRKVKLKPAAKLKKRKSYTIKLKNTAIKDVAGNQLVKPAKWSVVVY